jgi:hypothetical protein
MTYMLKLKKFISKFTDKKIPIGVNTSFDSGISSNSLTEAFDYPSVSNNSMKYSLREDIGSFEMIGTVRGSDNSTHYKLRSINTTEVFTISKKMLDLLFVPNRPK